MGKADGRRSQLLRGVLDLCLLAVMSEGAAYGYEMTKRLRGGSVDRENGQLPKFIFYHHYSGSIPARSLVH